MAATESSAPTASSTSFASRRPQARAALPPFTLPPPHAPAADTLGPPTPASASGSTPRHPSASPSYSATSSPGYSTGTTTTMLAHPQRASSHSPYESHRPLPSGAAATKPRLAPRPGPLSHPHGPDANLTTSPTRRRLPGPPAQLSPPQPTERLPPISSLIPPHERDGLRSPGHPGPVPPPGRGYLAMPMVKPEPPLYGLSRPLQTPWEYAAAQRSLPPHPLPLLREPNKEPLLSSHDRPFRCDLCTQRFSRNHDLKRHKRIHMASKPFPCTTCHKTFSRSDALKRHRLVKACQQKDEEARAEAAAAAAAARGSPPPRIHSGRESQELELPPTNFPPKKKEAPVAPSSPDKAPSPDS